MKAELGNPIFRKKRTQFQLMNFERNEIYFFKEKFFLLSNYL